MIPTKKILPLFLHFTFWVAVFCLTFSVSRIIFPFDISIQISLSRICTLIPLAYTNILVVIPRFFRQGKFVYFGGALFLLLMLSIISNRMIHEVSGLHEMMFQKFQENSSSTTGMAYKPFISFPQLFLSIIILFISSIYALIEKFLKKEQQTALLEREKTKHELNFLRSQINPHFLFNALNNLHAMIQLKPKSAGDSILRLGDMLRYVLEDCKKNYVPLSEEINYLQNYIFFQKQKDDQLTNVSFEVSGDLRSTPQVEPMLFIPLIENAFQHSYLTKRTKQFIAIRLTVKNKILTFQITNNLSQDIPNEHPPKSEHMGIGLKNIKRRLDLSYPGKYQLIYGPKNDKFTTVLTLKL